MNSNIVITCLVLTTAASFGCRDARESPPQAEAVCSPDSTIATVRDLNYPEGDCADAAAEAESSLGGYHYRTACEEAAPDAASPVEVSAAHVTDCRPTDGRGVFVDVEVCCSQESTPPPPPESVVHADGPDCAPWQTRARADELHYPDGAGCEEIVGRAESGLSMGHYRRACKAATPRTSRPARVLAAGVVECRTGGAIRGVVVDVELCCEAKVFEESEFRKLVWHRPPDEVRSALGEPQRISEWPQGPHWTYPIEVVRDERVFDEVTVVFVDNRVESYNF
jgi:hypothetical protein